jgi:thioredoxin reductase (NADPH)
MSKKAVIAGAGPAGLACATYLAEAGWSVDVFSNEENTESCLAEASIVKNYPGFPNGIEGVELLGLFVEQAQNAGVAIHPEGIASVHSDDKYVIDTNGARHPYDEYVEAVGCKRREYRCDGLELIPVHYCAICDGRLYGKEDVVVVIGGGDTAISSALYLSNLVKMVVMVVRKPNCRFTNKKAFDELCSKRNVVIEYETQLHHVSSDGDGNPVLHLMHKNQHSDEMIVGAKGLFVCIGCESNVVEHVGNGRIWRCGDCSNDKKQVAIAVGDGAGVAMDIIGA